MKHNCTLIKRILFSIKINVNVNFEFPLTFVALPCNYYCYIYIPNETANLMKLLSFSDDSCSILSNGEIISNYLFGIEYLPDIYASINTIFIEQQSSSNVAFYFHRD